jgi:hypothetical protein
MAEYMDNFENNLFCRFCEKKSATVHWENEMENHIYQVICLDCGCHSPIRPTYAGAVKSWTLLHGTKRKRD